MTPEEFMSQPDAVDEDDTVEATGGTDPLSSIAASLCTFVGILQHHEQVESAEDELRQTLDQLDRAYEELARDFDALQAKLEQVLEIVKPSTSKLANAIRAVLEPAAVEVPAPATEQPADDAPVEPPADDAPVEEWRAFGESRGLDLTDNLNRSQIRSALGIPQPAEVSA